MTDNAAELKSLRLLCPQTELWSDAGKPLAFLPCLRVQNGGTTVTLDALLVPWERDGYSSRLFLSAPLKAKNADNWNVFQIAGRAWHACSWQGVANSLPWVEMLAAHLRAFR